MNGGTLYYTGEAVETVGLGETVEILTIHAVFMHIAEKMKG
jgi:hypothetical protein